MDLRRKRRDKSRAAIEQAITRLASGKATHPRHVGIRVRISKAAVAREADVGQATLYRFPDLCAQIDGLTGDKADQTRRPSEQRRVKYLSEIGELKRQVAALLSENTRLTRELAKYDLHLGLPAPISLTERRMLK